MAAKKSKKTKKAEKKAMKAARRAEKRAAKQAGRAEGRPRKTAAAKTSKRTAKVARTRTAAPARKVFQERRLPETLRLRSAGPSFTVNDVEKSLVFYRDVLGFTEKERMEADGTLQGVELVAGRVSLWLGQDDWKKGRERAKGEGFRVYCDTTQDIDTLARDIRERGGILVEEPTDRPWGSRDFAVVDPDGFKITIASGF
jgi:uncharacterized glyoxalase superfamily protein PhnB